MRYVSSSERRSRCPRSGLRRMTELHDLSALSSIPGKRWLAFGRKPQGVRRNLLPESIDHMTGGRAACEPHAGIKYRDNLFVHQEISFVFCIDTSMRKLRNAETYYLTRLQRQHYDSDPRSEHSISCNCKLARRSLTIISSRP